MIADRYNVLLHRDGESIEATVRYYQDRDWEIAGMPGSIVEPDETPEEELSPHERLVHLVERLESDERYLHACGTCAHFRRSPNHEGSGWMGYCSYRDGDDEAPPIPGEVALLAPSCHAFRYAGTDQLLAERQDITHHGRRIDPEATMDFPAAEEEKQPNLLGRVREALGLAQKEPEKPVRADPVERPGNQACPVCGRNLTHRASVAHTDQGGAERVLSIWHCSNCAGNFLDDWSEAYVGSTAYEADRLFVVPPVDANRGVEVVIRNYRWDWKMCAAVAGRYYRNWIDELEQHGRRILQWEDSLKVEE